MSAKIQTFTVLCHWHSGVDACENWQLVTIVITCLGDAQDAANNACLYLIRDRQGQAEAALVIKGNPQLYDVDDAIFDAQEFEETITFAGRIVSVREVVPRFRKTSKP